VHDRVRRWGFSLQGVVWDNAYSSQGVGIILSGCGVGFYLWEVSQAGWDSKLRRGACSQNTPGSQHISCGVCLVDALVGVAAVPGECAVWLWGDVETVAAAHLNSCGCIRRRPPPPAYCLHVQCKKTLRLRLVYACCAVEHACCPLHSSAQSHCNRPDCPACACACYPPRSLCSYNLDTASSDRSTAQNYVSRPQGKQEYAICRIVTELCVGSLFLVLDLVYVPASHTVVLAVAAPAS
jgi:hypothetical protein